MSNPSNYGIFKGLCVAAPKFHENQDGSYTVFLSAAAQDNFPSGPKKEYLSHMANFRAFIPKGKDRGVYGQVQEGDTVAINYSIRNYRRDTGERTPDGRPLLKREVYLQISSLTIEAKRPD